MHLTTLLTTLLTTRLTSIASLAAFVALNLILFSPSAQAYRDGTFNCKNADSKIPANVYKIETVGVGTSGGTLPYVELTSYFRDTPDSPVSESHLKGFPTVWSDGGANDALLLGFVRLDFKSGELVHCKAP